VTTPSIVAGAWPVAGNPVTSNPSPTIANTRTLFTEQPPSVVWLHRPADRQVGRHRSLKSLRCVRTGAAILKTDRCSVAIVCLYRSVEVPGNTGITEGAIHGFEQSMDNAFMTGIQSETPVKGLYLAGAWRNSGGGFGGALNGGQAAFTALTKSWAQE